MARPRLDLTNLSDKERERVLRSRARAIAWGAAHKDHIREREALKHAADPEKYRARDRERMKRETREKPTQARARRKRWADAHPEELKAAIARWNRANRNRINRRKKERLETDIEFRLGLVLRARIRSALNKGKREGHPIRDLGCSLAELKAHLESLWTEGMSWGELRLWHREMEHRPCSPTSVVHNEQPRGISCGRSFLQSSTHVVRREQQQRCALCRHRPENSESRRIGAQFIRA